MSATTDWIQAISTFVGIPLVAWTLRSNLVNVKIASRQAEAAENGAEVGLKQIAQSVLAGDKATKPILILEWIARHEDVISQSDKIHFRVVNVGLGPALDIRMFYTDKPEMTILLKNDVLGLNQSFASACYEQNMALLGLTVAYKSVHGREHECLCRLHPLTLEYVQSHIGRKAPMDDLIEATFVGKW